MRKLIIGWLLLILWPALAGAQLTVCLPGVPTTPRLGLCERPGPDIGAPAGHITRFHPYTYSLQDNAEMLRLLDKYDAVTPRRVADCTLETDLYLNEVCTQTTGEIYQCVTPAFTGTEDLCDDPSEYALIGGSGAGSSSAAVLSAVSCTTDVTDAEQDDYCCNEGINGTCFQCESPGAGGASPILCDDPGDWQPKNAAAPSGDSAQTIYGNSGANPTVNLGANGKIYRNAVDPASSIQICDDVAPPNDQCWQLYVDPTTGPIQQTKEPSNTILKLHENFSLQVLDSADAVLFEVDEATGATTAPGLQHLDTLVFRGEDPVGTADTCRLGASGNATNCGMSLTYAQGIYYLAPFAGQIIALTCVQSIVPAGTTYTFTAKAEDTGTTVSCAVTASGTPCTATVVTPLAFTVGQRIGVTMVESGTGGDGALGVCSLGVQYAAP